MFGSTDFAHQLKWIGDLADAIDRAAAYLDAGADGIMIHSQSAEPDEVLEFCKSYREFSNGKPLVAVPTTYNAITEEELVDAGVNVVIYANHLLRSAYPAMVEACERILTNHRSKVEDIEVLTENVLSIGRELAQV